MNKTPITVLQELMIKYQQVPSFECIAQTGPQHLALFEYRCVARGVTGHGIARSKKEAKQEAARRVLAALAKEGLSVPASYSIAPQHRTGKQPAVAANESALSLPSSSEEPGELDAGGGPARVDVRSYVTLLKELCEEFRLGEVTYDLVGDTGPPHLRMFSMRAALASHERVATASTKKVARQMAAEQLYTYLRENLAVATKDFVEEEALSRALDKVMSRYMEIREEQPWRPDLGQRISDYHLGVFANFSDQQRLAAEQAAAADSEDSAAVLQETATALGLTVGLSTLPAESGSVSVVSLGPTAPAITVAGRDPPAATRAALRYLRRALRQRPEVPRDTYT